MKAWCLKNPKLPLLCLENKVELLYAFFKQAFQNPKPLLLRCTDKRTSNNALLTFYQPLLLQVNVKSAIQPCCLVYPT